MSKLFVYGLDVVVVVVSGAALLVAWTSSPQPSLTPRDVGAADHARVRSCERALELLEESVSEVRATRQDGAQPERGEGRTEGVMVGELGARVAALEEALESGDPIDHESVVGGDVLERARERYVSVFLDEGNSSVIRGEALELLAKFPASSKTMSEGPVRAEIMRLLGGGGGNDMVMRVLHVAKVAPWEGCEGDLFEVVRNSELASSARARAVGTLYGAPDAREELAAMKGTLGDPLVERVLDRLLSGNWMRRSGKKK